MQKRKEAVLFIAVNRHLYESGSSRVHDRDAGIDIDWAEHFVYDGDHIALVFDEAGSLKNRYLHGPAIDQVLAEETFDSMGISDEVCWQLADNLGSIRDVVTYDDSTDTATTVEHIVYGAFGNIISATSSIIVRFAYTGREFDIETGMYYFRARYYDDENGRFISEDPIGFAAGDPNLVRYVSNLSTMHRDPMGLDPSSSISYWDTFVDNLWPDGWTNSTVDTNGRRNGAPPPPPPKPLRVGCAPAQRNPHQTIDTTLQDEFDDALYQLEYEVGSGLAEQGANYAMSAVGLPLVNGFLGKTAKYVLERMPKGWRRVPPRSGYGWVLLDENGIERIRYMRPDPAGRWAHQKTGYWRIKDACNNYLDEFGNIVADSDPLFHTKTHIPYSGVR